MDIPETRNGEWEIKKCEIEDSVQLSDSVVV